MLSPQAVAALADLAAAIGAPATTAAQRRAIEALGDEADALRPLLAALVGGAREVERLARLAATDSLTGLAHRRIFEETLDREVARLRRSRTNFAVILLDLDGLKRLNDAWGHGAGDDAIRAMAHATRTTLRATDLAARLGGDELAVLAMDVDRYGAREVAARLREAIEAVRVAGEPLRVSIGVAVTSRRGTTAEDLMAAADAALYAEKLERRRAGFLSVVGA